MCRWFAGRRTLLSCRGPPRWMTFVISALLKYDCYQHVTSSAIDWPSGGKLAIGWAGGWRVTPFFCEFFACSVKFRLLLASSGSNEVETVLFPLGAVDQPVLVEPVVAVEEGNKRAWHVFSCKNDHGAQQHHAHRDGQLRHAAGFTLPPNKVTRRSPSGCRRTSAPRCPGRTTAASHSTARCCGTQRISHSAGSQHLALLQGWSLVVSM